MSCVGSENGAQSSDHDPFRRYGELALLLPNTDIELVMFGSSVVTLLQAAKRKSSCVAAQRYAYSYTAPEASGGSTIRISLAKYGNWDGRDLKNLKARPDAIIACNAGLLSYPAWKPVLVASRALAIPMAVTDYDEPSVAGPMLEQMVFGMLTVLARTTPWPYAGNMTQEMRKRVLDESFRATSTLRLNPFMYLGPRSQAHMRAPSSINGFEMIVTRQDHDARPGLDEIVASFDSDFHLGGY